MEAVGYDDLTVGQVFESIGRTVTETDLVVFNNMMWITSPTHTDEEFMRASGGAVAAGTFTLSMVMGLIAATGWTHGTLLGVLAQESIRYVGPVRAGDTLHATCEVLEKRETSKPDRGVAMVRDRAYVGNDTLVLEGQRSLLMRRAVDA
ncbi:MAG: MaoC family dehydratase [Actinophytocola sp.]